MVLDKKIAVLVFLQDTATSDFQEKFQSPKFL